MKVLAFLVAMCCVVSGFCGKVTHPLQNASDVVILFARPKSGTNWSSCSIQYLTHRPLAPLQTFPNPHGLDRLNRLKVKIDYTKPTIYKAYQARHIASLDPQKNKVIILQRSYRELFFRHRSFANDQEFRHASAEFIPKYISFITECERWPEDRKFRYSYEEFMTDPETVLTGILEFLDEPKDRLDDYLGSIDQLKPLALNTYINQHGRSGLSVRKGVDLHAHTRKAPAKYISWLDQEIREAAGEVLWEKYLKQYFVPVPKGDR